MRKDRRRPPIGNVKKSVKNSHTSPKQIELQQKRAEALEYRLQGYSYPQIAEAMESTVPTVFRWVDEAMQAITREAAQNVKKMELQRLDQMQAGCFQNAAQGDHAAINSVLRIMERRARLEGVDAPVKGEFAGPGGSPLVTEIAVHFVDPPARIANGTKSK